VLAGSKTAKRQTSRIHRIEDLLTTSAARLARTRFIVFVGASGVKKRGSLLLFD
jgi:hypothetical protein